MSPGKEVTQQSLDGYCVRNVSSWTALARIGNQQVSPKRATPGRSALHHECYLQTTHAGTAVGWSNPEEYPQSQESTVQPRWLTHLRTCLPAALMDLLPYLREQAAGIPAENIEAIPAGPSRAYMMHLAKTGYKLWRRGTHAS